MNHTRKYLWTGLLLAVPTAIHGQSVDTDKSATTDRGQINGLAYSNTALGFSYQLPQGFLVNPDNVRLGNSILMVADKHSGTPSRDRIVTGGRYRKIFRDHRGLRDSFRTLHGALRPYCHAA